MDGFLAFVQGAETLRFFSPAILWLKTLTNISADNGATEDAMKFSAACIF